MLLNRKTDKSRPDDLVFPSKQGNHIDDHNFRNRAWKSILEKLNITYRKPYNTRHSFVSHAAALGMGIADIAEITGHSERTLLENYMGSVKGKVVLPEILKD